MSPLSPPRSFEPFQRLQVSDGLLINAERWQQAHRYHRQRQNIQYQALNQGGIVWGLGICEIAPPTDIADEFRDRRWLEIQPGLAIDAQGNPIVVPQAMAFRIASAPPAQGLQFVYLSLRYVDPDTLQGQSDREFVSETFRIEETATPPQGTQVELCRILLQPGEVQLQSSLNVLAPGINQLDLRNRMTAQARAPLDIKVALTAQGLTPEGIDAIATHFSSLFRSFPALYPAMQGTSITPVNLQPEELHSLAPHLLYLTYPQFLSLTPAARDTLRQYLATGAIVWIEISAQDAKIADFSAVRQQLNVAIANLSPKPEFDDIRQDLEAESLEMQTLIDRYVLNCSAPIWDMAQQMGLPDESADFPNHPLQNQPFLFGQLPIIEGCPLYVLTWGGVVFSIGSISRAWGLDSRLSLSRETIRAAQEWGINLLHFGWRRYQLTQLQQREL
ncbi:MAG: hypothetical protein HC852_09555 [Acaryochloridaceae cyanobacterium RU_4_10]|nr:hypothetical protein [Acaryochloridaceae cyanobacterium RU_4_10]